MRARPARLWTTARFVRWLFALLVALAAQLPSAPASAGKLRIRGAAAIDARTVVLPQGFEVRGNVRDDAGRPLGPTHVRMRVKGGGAELRLPQATLCAPSPDVHEARGFPDEPDEYVIDTNAAGAFCVRVDMPLGDASIELEVGATRDVDGGKTKLELDSAKRTLILLFTPEPRSLSLDQTTELFNIDTRVQPAEPETTELIELSLLLLDRTQPQAKAEEIAKTAVKAGDRARFEVETRLLGRPGPALLSVRFAGSRTLTASEKSALVERTTRVELKLPEQLPEVDPSAGVEIDVEVGSKRGPVPGGSVEALLGGQTVGTAAVKDGRASLVAEFQVASGTSVPLTLRYLPGAPWWLASPPTQVVLPVKPPSPLRRVPWIVAALAIAAWILRGWWRPTRITRPTEPKAGVTPAGAAAVEVVQAGTGHFGWRGLIVDAHDGTHIAGARVTIEQPSFAVARQLVAVSDADGGFTIDAPDRPLQDGSRLRVVSANHSVLERPAPPQGQVVIQLVSRRRTLLDTLVSWARRHGAPWAGATEPTPGHVATLARNREQENIASWASEIENAAFGATDPDEGHERRLREAEPP